MHPIWKTKQMMYMTALTYENFHMKLNQVAIPLESLKIITGPVLSSCFIHSSRHFIVNNSPTQKRTLSDTHVFVTFFFFFLQSMT